MVLNLLLPSMCWNFRACHPVQFMDQTQVFVHVIQALYPLSYIPSPKLILKVSI